MSQFTIVPSVKFEILLPATYIDPHDPTETPRFVQRTEVARYLVKMTEKYGGYTISNPYAPPPFEGGYEGGPRERSWLVMIIIPDHLVNEAEQDIQEMVSFFQQTYHQAEILAYHYAINRYVPAPPPNF